MSKTIPVDQLPREAERLLRPAWEEQESVVLERNGELVAAVVPMDEYRRWQPETEKAKDERRKGRDRNRKAKTSAARVAPLAYELPTDVLEAYHRLVSKKFAKGLTAEEEAELERLGAKLDAADAATPLERTAWKAHQRRMAMIDELIERLRALQSLR